MFAASLSVRSGPPVAEPAPSPDTAPAYATAGTASMPVVHQASPAYPAIFPGIQKKLDDFYMHGTVPDDPYIQASIVKKYLKKSGSGELQAFLKKAEIDTLVLSHRPLDIGEAKTLAAVLKTNDTLRHLDLKDCRLDSTALTIICEALEENATLISVDLGTNEAERELKVKALGKLIAKNRTLQCLGLAQLELGPEGGCQIAESLKTNRTLKKIDFRFNQLESAGGTAVLDALECHPALKSLNLAGNGISGAGVDAIVRLLRNNATLSELDLATNGLFFSDKETPGKAIDSVIEALENNPVVTILGLENNHPRSWLEVTSAPVSASPASQQREQDMGRINDLLHRNRTLDEQSTRDTVACSKLLPGQRLSPDEGKLLANAMIMAASSTAAHEATMVEIQCALNLLESQSQANPAAH